MVDRYETEFSSENKAVIVTPWSKVLLQKTKASQLPRTFNAFNLSGRSVTILTRADYRSLSVARWNQLTCFHAVSLRSILKYLPVYTEVFRAVSLLQASQPNIFMHFSSASFVLHASPISSSFIQSY